MEVARLDPKYSLEMKNSGTNEKISMAKLSAGDTRHRIKAMHSRHHRDAVSPTCSTETLCRLLPWQWTESLRGSAPLNATDAFINRPLSPCEFAPVPWLCPPVARAHFSMTTVSTGVLTHPAMSLPVLQAISPPCRMRPKWENPQTKALRRAPSIVNSVFCQDAFVPRAYSFHPYGPSFHPPGRWGEGGG